MKITVSGEKKEVADGITVSALIEQEQVETPQYVTVSVNEEFIDKDAFDTHVLNEGDEIEFLYFPYLNKHTNQECFFSSLYLYIQKLLLPIHLSH